MHIPTGIIHCTLKTISIERSDLLWHFEQCLLKTGIWTHFSNDDVKNVLNSPLYQLIFPLSVSSLNNVYYPISRTTNFQLYSNISQILLLYKVWGCYNKFDYITKFHSILLIYQNAMMRVCGAWIEIYYVLYSKLYSTLCGLFWTPCWFAVGH